MLSQIKTTFIRHAAKLAFCIGTQSYSYEEWLGYVNGIREMLQAERPAGHFIGLAAYDDMETYAAILALWAEGYAFVPLSPQNPTERNASIMAQVESNVVLSSRSANEQLIGDQGINWLPTKDLKAKGEAPDLSNLEADQILCMLFTSGSTGVPKGVPMTTLNINTTLISFFEEGYELSAEDRFLQMFELTFDMSMISYLPAWCIGASVHTVASEGIKYLNAFKVMQEQAISFVTTVPSTLQLLKPYFLQINLPAVRYSLQGGEPFYADLAEAWMNCVPNATVINLSGPCETTMACMSYALDRNLSNNKKHNNILAFGGPWKRTTVLLLNEKGEDSQTGEEGELCFSGEHVMKGYWQMPEKNAAVFFDKKREGKLMRFYRSGDMAFRDGLGIYYSIGRKDIQYKIQGYKVELGDIEQHTQHFLKGWNAIAHVNRNEKGLLDIHLFIDKPEVDKVALAKYLETKLPTYMQARSIHLLEKLPLTISGKLDRKRIATIFEGDDFDFITKEKIAERIRDNVFSVYQSIAKIIGTEVWENGNLKAVDLSPSSWPKTAFGNPEVKEFELLAEAMLNKSIPSRVILQRPIPPEVHYHQLGILGFKHLASWPGMAVNLHAQAFANTKYNSILIKTESHLQQWVDILNDVFFSKEQLTSQYIKQLWASDDFLFYGLLENEVIVATALGFKKDKGLGIYMVAVKETHRRKGYAGTLMRAVLAEAKASGCHAAYLQSTKMGKGMYGQLGFGVFSDFDIFGLEPD
ncbi:MAG: D-alanine--poly(phosphoribitol) ligase subunit 1 [Polaribacter sp.]|jgi:D-alanine--poly(phosphoribitol) ligase subunit 1